MIYMISVYRENILEIKRTLITVKDKTIEVVLLKRFNKSDIEEFCPVEFVIAGLKARKRERVSGIENRLKGM